MGATKGRIWSAFPDPSRFARLLTVPLQRTALLPPRTPVSDLWGKATVMLYLQERFQTAWEAGYELERVRWTGGLKGSVAAIGCRRGGLLPSQRRLHRTSSLLLSPPIALFFAFFESRSCSLTTFFLSLAVRAG